MLDIGFWELVIIAVLGIVVVGPEKLPGVVRHFMRTIRKLRHMFDEMRSDIERELDLDEIHRFMEENEVGDSLRTFNDSVDAIGHDLRATSENFLDRREDEFSDIEDASTSADKRAAARGNASRPVAPPAIRSGGRQLAHEKEDGVAAEPVLDGETYRDTGIERPIHDEKKDA